MKWIRSAMQTSEYEEVYVLEGTLLKDKHNNGSFGSGIWLTVTKDRFIIIDMTPRMHEVLAQGYNPEIWKEI
jgi:hypothetical protein